MSEPSPPGEIAPETTDSADRSALLWVVVGIAILTALYVARDVLIPITLAILLAFVLSPIVAMVGRLRIPRVVCVVVAVVLAIGIILSVASLIGVQVANMAANLPRYETTVQSKIDTVERLVFGRLTAVLDRLSHRIVRDHDTSNLELGTGGMTATPVPVEMPAHRIAPLDIAQWMLPVINRLETLAIVLMVTIFVLLQTEDLLNRFTFLLGSRDPEGTALAMSDAARRLGRYFLSQLSINVSVGIVIGSGLFLIGVPNPVLWGILFGLLRFVPYVGPVIGTLLPVIVAAAVSPGWGMALQAAALVAVVEPLVGQFVEPAIYGHSTGMSPLGVVIAAIVWTWLWGPIGLIISTPVTLCLLVLSRHVPRLAFLDVLLGDNPAGTPRRAPAR